MENRIKQEQVQVKTSAAEEALLILSEHMAAELAELIAGQMVKLPVGLTELVVREMGKAVVAFAQVGGSSYQALHQMHLLAQVSMPGVAWMVKTICLAKGSSECRMY